MKKFIIRSIFFLLLITPVPFVLDYIITDSLKTSRRYNFSEWNDITDGKIDADLAIYGSSRAWRHFDPKILEDTFRKNVYNLGLDGYQFHMQYARHLIFTKHNPLPKNIILSIDYWTLGKTNELYMPEQFLPYFEETDLKEFTKYYKGLDFWDYHLPFVRYFGRTKYIVHAIDILINKKNNYFVKYKGFQGEEASWEGGIDEAVKKMKEKNNMVNNANNALDFTIDTLTLKLFEQFLKEIHDKQVNLIFVFSPVHIDGQKQVEHNHQFIQRFKNYANQYNYPFYDFSNESICLDKKYFYNATHLNKRGAEAFTKKLASIISLK